MCLSVKKLRRDLPLRRHGFIAFLWSGPLPDQWIEAVRIETDALNRYSAAILGGDSSKDGASMSTPSNQPQLPQLFVGQNNRTLTHRTNELQQVESPICM